MKKAPWICCVLLMIVLTISGCERRTVRTGSSNGISSSASSSSRSSTEDNLKYIAATKLAQKISSLISSGTISSDIDVGNTKYEITKMEENDGSYTVYGNGYFYDSYGKLCEATSKSTSSYSFTFYVTVDSNSRTDCVINYK